MESCNKDTFYLWLLDYVQLVLIPLTAEVTVYQPAIGMDSGKISMDYFAI